MNIAAIDIGSNGARLLIKSFNKNTTDPSKRLKKLMFVRIPLRLGKDVFTLERISKEREHMMVHMMKGFKQFMKLYQVERYRACATSAMRDAANGKHVMKTIRRESGIRLEIIEGTEEARLLCSNLIEKTDSNQGNFAYIDVGGGSTEVSLLHDGTLAESHSFNIGTLRLLSGKVTAEEEEELKQGLTDYANKYKDIQIIGSGGNINKLYKIGQTDKKRKEISLDELKRLYGILQPMSIEERIAAFNLKDDRADVIVPAAAIFIRVCEYLKATAVRVPNISLADSIVDGLALSDEQKERPDSE